MWNTLNSHFRREFIWLILALLLGSVLATSLLVVRAIYSWKLAHAYLVWNLFLAWIPLGFALLDVRHRTNIRRLIIFSMLWLLFLPNAPYLVTDLVHLRERPPVPLWFDMVLLQSFIGLGLVLGLISLYKMQWVATIYLGRRGSWIFVMIVIALTGFGIYLGRVQRWNSWDLILNPIGLFVDIFKHFAPPHRRVAGLFTILHAGFFFIAYTMFYGLTHLKFAIKEETTTAMNREHILRRRVKWLTWFFIFGLVVSGVTAIPLEWEMELLTKMMGIAHLTPDEAQSGLAKWLLLVRDALKDTNATYPFIAYGFDWLAFGHIAIAVAFIGPLRDPVRNIWIFEFGMIACLLVIPWAFIFGEVRGIPIAWRLIDCAFGIIGIVPLWLARKWTREISTLEYARQL